MYIIIQAFLIHEFEPGKRKKGQRQREIRRKARKSENHESDKVLVHRVDRKINLTVQMRMRKRRMTVRQSIG
jgi:hypothetical protein